MIRKLTLLLTLILLINNSLCAFAITDSEVVNVENEKFEIASEFLKETNLAEFNSEDRFKGIRRGEFAKMIATILGFEEVETTEEVIASVDKFTDYWTELEDAGWEWLGDYSQLESEIADGGKATLFGFNDVYSDNEYKSYIEIVSSLGLMNGSDGNFYPENLITGNEAVKVMVMLLKADITVNGGYPYGYLSVGGKLGVLDNVDNFNGSEYLTRENAAIIFYNTLHGAYYSAGTYAQIGDEVFVGDIEQYSDRLLMSMLYNMYYEDGIVTSDGVTSIDGGDINENRISIDGIAYENASINTKDLIGRKVRLYYTMEENEDEKNAFYVRTLDNESVYLTKDEIGSYDGGVFSYYINNNKKTMNVTLDTKVIYNDQYLDDYTKECFDIETGDITLIDNDKDGRYEVIIINKGTLVIVDSVNTEMEQIYDRDGIDYIINYNDIDFYVEDMNGNRMDVDAIKSGNVVFYKKSLSQQENERISLVVSTKNIGGVVTGVDASNNEVYIDDIAYSCSPRYTLDENIIGEAVRFYVDPYDNLVYMVRDTNGHYAYIMDIGKSSGLDDVYKIKLYTTDGKAVVYTLPRVMKFNNENTKAEDAYNLIVNSGTNQVVQYEANDKNELTTILQADVDDEKFVKSYSGSTSATYKGTPKGFFTTKSVAFVDTDTIYLEIMTKGDASDEESYAWIPSTTIQVDDKKSVVAEVYTAGKDAALADLIVVHNSNALDGNVTTSSTVPVLVRKISKIDVDGTEGYKILAYQNGVSKTFKSKRDDLASLIEGTSVGDMVRIENDAKGYVKAYQMVFDKDTMAMSNGTNPQSTSSSNNFLASLSLIHGVAYSKHSDTNYYEFARYTYTDKVKGSLNLDDKFTMNLKGCKVQIYDSKSDETYIGTASDLILMEQSGIEYEVVLLINWGSVKGMTVYK